MIIKSLINKSNAYLIIQNKHNRTLTTLDKLYFYVFIYTLYVACTIVKVVWRLILLIR